MEGHSHHVHNRTPYGWHDPYGWHHGPLSDALVGLVEDPYGCRTAVTYGWYGHPYGWHRVRLQVPYGWRTAAVRLSLDIPGIGVL